LVKCGKCGNEAIEDDSVFCRKCGSKISANDATSSLKRKKFVIFGSVGLLVLVAIGATLILLNNPFTKFKNAVEANQYSDATTVYNQKIKGNSEQEKKAENFIKDELNRINQDFKSNKIDYQKVISALDTIKKLELLKADVDAATNSINKLNDSRTSFKKGQEFIASKSIKDGISEFKKVITEDENYAKAQELITTYTTEYKTTALKDAEQLSTNTEFDKAISILSDALVILPNDSDVSAKKASYEKMNEEKRAVERKKKMEETKASQEVVAEKASIIVQDERYKSIYPDMIQVIVRNNSNKTVKNMTVSNLGYDTNGLPVKIKTQFSFSNASFEFVGSGQNVNIISKATFGEGKGWNLDESHGIKTVISCVKEVEYYDGSKWTNPYYDYWLAENKEKPLH
jgi:tetratricopeptide (TPR) repeat protein